jgi:hypothetical protein
MIRTLQEWFDWSFERGTSGEMVFDILADWKECLNEVQTVIKLLSDALDDATAHLEYCGYGDEYEKECARDDKLPQRLAIASDTATEWLGKHIEKKARQASLQ